MTNREINFRVLYGQFTNQTCFADAMAKAGKHLTQPMISNRLRGRTNVLYRDARNIEVAFGLPLHFLENSLLSKSACELLLGIPRELRCDVIRFHNLMMDNGQTAAASKGK